MQKCLPLGNSWSDGTQPGVLAVGFHDPHCWGFHQTAQAAKECHSSITGVVLNPGYDCLAHWIYPTVHSDQYICHVTLSSWFPV